MKTKYFLLFLAFGLISNTFSQKVVIELTFSAEQNGQHIPLDSISIENLTQGGDTTLIAPDTLLVLDYVSSIVDNGTSGENTFSVSQNYPNPFNGRTEFNLYLPEKEYIKINIHDIGGRNLTQYRNTLCGGNHSFTFYSGSEMYYLLTVIGEKTSKTTRMINANDNSIVGSNYKIVYNRYENKVIGFKSQKAIISFGFSIGDELKYTGYSDNEETSIIDSPTGNQSYTLLFASNIPCPETPTVTYEGQVYNTVLIGSQCWLKENLNYGQ